MLTAAALLATLLASLGASTVAAATVVYVGCPNGVGNTHKLVRTIREANQRPASTTTRIYLYPSCSYLFHHAHSFPGYGSNALPIVKGHVEIYGRGASIGRLGTAPRFRILAVAATGQLKLKNLHLSNGAARDGRPGLTTFGSDGGNGTDGRHGGAIYNLGQLEIDLLTLNHNEAGRGGAGGNAISLDAADGSTAGQNGDDALNVTGGNGGNGGNGGAIYNRGTLVISRSTLVDNRAGDGGRGGEGNGGDGGDGAFGTPGGNGGHGGGANGGQGGDGGRGGAIFNTGNMSVSNSLIDGNRAGHGADAGTATAGKGGDGASLEGDGGDGGGANSWFGGNGGEGGAVFLLSGSATFESDIVSNNSGGDSGGGNAFGGDGGNGGCSGNGGSGGGAIAGPGTSVGLEGGIYNDSATLVISNSILTGNTAGDVGATTASGGSGGSGGGACS